MLMRTGCGDGVWYLFFWRNSNCAFNYRVNYRVSSACNVGASGEKNDAKKRKIGLGFSAKKHIKIEKALKKKYIKKGAEFQSLFFRFTGQYGRIELISERIKNVFFERIYERL